MTAPPDTEDLRPATRPSLAPVRDRTGLQVSCPICAGPVVVPAADTPNPVWSEVLAMLRKPLCNRLWEIASRAIMLGTPVYTAMYSALSQRDQYVRELLRRGTTKP